ncbi:MAG: hypothetical protein V4530_06195 [Pseudomonadota bacterium]
MSAAPSAANAPIVSPDQVRLVMQGLLNAAQRNGWTDPALEAASGVPARAIKSYRVEGKEPSISAALSIACALGAPAVNVVLSLIGYTGAHPMDEPEKVSPSEIVAKAMSGLSRIATAAVDNHINHLEAPDCRTAADQVIAAVMPLSSLANAG